MEDKGEKEKKAQRKKGWGARTQKIPTPAPQRKAFGFRFGSIGTATGPKSDQGKVSKGEVEQLEPFVPPDRLTLTARPRDRRSEAEPLL